MQSVTGMGPTHGRARHKNNTEDEDPDLANTKRGDQVWYCLRIPSVPGVIFALEEVELQVARVNMCVCVCWTPLFR